MYDNIVSKTKELPAAQLEIELEQFFKEPEQTPTLVGESITVVDSDEWWERNRSRYPVLYRLHTMYHCIPATSIRVERLFSSIGQRISDVRARYDPDIASLLTYLRENRHIVRKLFNIPTPQREQSQME